MFKFLILYFLVTSEVAGRGAHHHAKIKSNATKEIWDVSDSAQLINVHNGWVWRHFISIDSDGKPWHKGVKGNLISFDYTPQNLSSYDW